MNVIHIIDSGGFYGAEVMLLNLCKEQIKQGLAVEVISIGTANRPPKPIEIKLQEAQITCTPWPMRPLPDPRQSLKILDYCRTKKADVIHSHGYKGNILLAMIPKRKRGIAVITTVHGYTRQQGINKLAVYQWLDRQCLTRLDAVIAVSPSMATQIPTQKIADKLQYIANGIALEPEITNENYFSLFTSNTLKIGALGRLSHEKNFSLLINAIKLITLQGIELELVIYGEGSERSKLEEKIKEHSLEKIIKLPGYLTTPHAFLQDIDLFINCSITEGMPISLLEAMRAGTNIIATDIPANKSLLNESKHLNQLCGLQPESLASAIIEYSNTTKELRVQQIEGNRKIFIANYTLTKMTHKYIQLYNRLNAT